MQLFIKNITNFPYLISDLGLEIEPMGLYDTSDMDLLELSDSRDLPVAIDSHCIVLITPAKTINSGAEARSLLSLIYLVDSDIAPGHAKNMSRMDELCLLATLKQSLRNYQSPLMLADLEACIWGDCHHMQDLSRTTNVVQLSGGLGIEPQGFDAFELSPDNWDIDSSNIEITRAEGIQIKCFGGKPTDMLVISQKIAKANWGNFSHILLNINATGHEKICIGINDTIVDNSKFSLKSGQQSVTVDISLLPRSVVTKISLGICPHRQDAVRPWITDILNIKLLKNVQYQTQGEILHCAKQRRTQIDQIYYHEHCLLPMGTDFLPRLSFDGGESWALLPKRLRNQWLSVEEIFAAESNRRQSIILGGRLIASSDLRRSPTLLGHFLLCRYK